MSNEEHHWAALVARLCPAAQDIQNGQLTECERGGKRSQSCRCRSPVQQTLRSADEQQWWFFIWWHYRNCHLLAASLSLPLGCVYLT